MVLWLIYSKKYNYGVQYSAKSGCSTLRRLFLELHSDELNQQPRNGHHEIQHYFQLPPTISWDTLPNFVLVRNPYTRVLSMFFNKYLYPSWNTIKSQFDKNKIVLKEHTFYNFLLVLQNLKKRGKLNNIEVHINEQVHKLKQNKLTQIVKLENIETELIETYSKLIKNDEFIEKVKDKFNELITNTALLNKTTIVPLESNDESSMAYYSFPMGTKNAPPYWKFYDDSKIVDLVYEIYESDFKTFGYDKDSYPKP